MFASEVFTLCPACRSARLRVQVLVACRPPAGSAILWAEKKMQTRKHGAGSQASAALAAKCMHAARGRAWRAAWPSARPWRVASAAWPARWTAAAFFSFYLTLPYLTLPYLTLPYQSVKFRSIHIGGCVSTPLRIPPRHASLISASLLLTCQAQFKSSIDEREPALHPPSVRGRSATPDRHKTRRYDAHTHRLPRLLSGVSRVPPHGHHVFERILSVALQVDGLHRIGSFAFASRCPPC